MNFPTSEEYRRIEIIQNEFRAAEMLAVDDVWEDAVAVPTKHNSDLLSNIDASLAGIHFPWPSDRFSDIGYRAVQAAASDLAAAGATPSGFLFSLQLPKNFTHRSLEQLAAGSAEAARQLDAPLLGGNVTRGDLALHVAVFGRATARRMRRGGASAGDTLWLTGHQGDAAAGLYLSVKGADGTKPEQQLEAAFWRPQARVEWGRWLSEQPEVRGVIDISDGWLRDAVNLVRKSGYGLRINPETIPRSKPWQQVVAIRDGVRRASYWGGDDFELGFLTRGVSADVFRSKMKAVGLIAESVGNVTGDAGLTWETEPEVDPPAGFGYDPYL